VITTDDITMLTKFKLIFPLDCLKKLNFPSCKLGLKFFFKNFKYFLTEIPMGTVLIASQHKSVKISGNLFESVIIPPEILMDLFLVAIRQMFSKLR